MYPGHLYFPDFTLNLGLPPPHFGHLGMAPKVYIALNIKIFTYPSATLSTSSYLVPATF
jgi:hypothetical protein